MAVKSERYFDRIAKGAVPPLLVVFLLFASSYDDSPSVFAGCVLFGVCGAILWGGWRWTRQTLVTKWIGILLGIYVGLILGLLAFGIALGIGVLLIGIFLLALPFIVYDLAVRQPHKGRFMRARAARKGITL